MHTVNTGDIDRGYFVGDANANNLYMVSGRFNGADNDTVLVVGANTPTEAVDAFVAAIHRDRGFDVPVRDKNGEWGDQGFQIVDVFFIGSKV